MKSLRQQVILVNSMWKKLNRLKTSEKATKRFLEEEAKKKKTNIKEEDLELLSRMQHQITRTDAQLRNLFKEELK